MEFSNEEKTDLLVSYIRAFRNAQNAIQLYQDLYPERRIPNAKIFHRLERNLREHGSFSKPNKRKATSTLEGGDNEINVLGIFFNL